MFSTGDLVPQQSGSASIGARQNGLHGFSNSILPYAHMHMNSGVIHDPANGQSGVIRFAMKNDLSYFDPIGHHGDGEIVTAGQQSGFEFSVNGGQDFPLLIGATQAFDLGEGNTKRVAIITTLDGVASPAPLVDDLHIKTSGELQLIGRSNIHIIQDKSDQVSEGILISSRGVMFIDGLVTRVTSGTDLDLAASGNAVVTSDDGDVILKSGGAFGLPDGDGEGGQIQLRAFAASGILDYRFGPHQAWYSKSTHSSTGGPFNDGFWPIAHSGNVLEMIARSSPAQMKAMTIERPALNNDLTWFYTNQAITVTEVESVLRGTFDASGSFAIRHSTDRSLAGTELTAEAIQCTNRTTGQITTSFVGASIPADSWVWIGVSGVSGVATSQLGITMQFS